MTSLLKPIALDEGLVSDGDYLADVSDDEAGSAQPKHTSRLRNHDRLLKSIAKLDRTPHSHRKIERSEPAAKIGDQNISGSTLRAVSVSALLQNLDSSLGESTKKKKQRTDKPSKVLAEPLKKNETTKLQRVVAYEEISKDLKKWDTIVASNRLQEGVSFPLDQTKLIIQTASEYVKRYQTKSAFEQEIEDLVGSSKNNLTSSTILTEAEREALKAMSLQEAEFRRQELQKTRALLSYKEQKARRQSKIKSKGYHRHLRRAKRKADEKDFDELKLTDPEAATRKLEVLDKQRVQERMTLKHRSTGKWARRMATRGKTDKTAREALQEQLRLSRALAEKIRPLEEESSETDEEPVLVRDQTIDDVLDAEASVNPWMNAAVGSSWEDDTMDKVFESLEISEQEKAKKPPQTKKISKKPLENRSRPSSKTSRRRARSNSDDEAVELTDGGEIVVDAPNVAASRLAGVSQRFQKRLLDTDIDPCKLLLAEKAKVSKTLIPLEESDGEDHGQQIDSDDDQRGVIAEAFADDDVVGEFDTEKKNTEEQEKPKDIDLTLPGWGEWAGAGIGESVVKKQKFIVKAPKGKARKDKFLPNVFISERQDEKIVPHQVRELPFPFTTVAQFHSSIRMPVGKLWNTEAAFDELTKPKIITQMGAIIKPLNPVTALRKGKRKHTDVFQKDESSLLGRSEVTIAGKTGLRNGRQKRKRL